LKTSLIAFFLLTVVMAAFGGNPYARVTAAKTQIENFSTALAAFKKDCNRYPSTVEGLEALVVCPTNISAAKWKESYLKREIPLDPWGHPYIYLCPGLRNTNSFDIYSCGSDGISKTGGADRDDINNWDPESPHDTRGNWMGLAICAALLLVSVGIAAWYRRVSKAEGNWDGVLALILVLGMVTPFLTPLGVDLLNAYETPVALVLLLSFVAANVLALSGLRRGCPISKVYGLLAFIALFLILYEVFVVPKFTG